MDEPEMTQRGVDRAIGAGEPARPPGRWRTSARALRRTARWFLDRVGFLSS